MSSPTSNEAINPETVKKLAKGVMELFEPPLATINTHLKELTERQDLVHTMIVSERRKLEDLQNDATLDALLADVSTSREKLVSLSSNMMTLHKRVQSLQARANNVAKVANQKASRSQTSNTTNFSITSVKEENRALQYTIQPCNDYMNDDINYTRMLVSQGDIIVI